MRFAPLRRSPIVGFCSGTVSFAPNAPDGANGGCIVFTAESPQARFETDAGSDAHVAVNGPRRTVPVGV